MSYEILYETVLMKFENEILRQYSRKLKIQLTLTRESIYLRISSGNALQK